MTSNEDQGVLMDQCRGAVQGLSKNPKEKVVSMGAESDFAGPVVLFSSVNLAIVYFIFTYSLSVFTQANYCLTVGYSSPIKLIFPF